MFTRVMQCVRRVFVLGVFACLTAQTQGQVNVTTQHNDNSRTGQNTLETILTPSAVQANFGKLVMVAVDGQVYAQPLVMTNVSIGGGTHNVVYVVTEHDSVYGLDAKTGVQYWKTSFLGTGVTTVASSQASTTGCSDISTEYGITSTPVIDPSTGTLYVVANTNDSGTIRYRLHALSISTGAEKFGGPVVIQASVAGNAEGSVNGLLTFNAKQHHQRPALLLTNGHVILGFGSHCDHSPYYGWVMSYNTATLAQEAVFNTESKAGSSHLGGAVWMSGGGPAADAAGNIYVATGNSLPSPDSEDGTLSYGDSLLKLPPPVVGKAWALSSFFTPWNGAALNQGDLDLGSGGVLLLPQLPTGQPHPSRLIQAGKIGWIEVADQASLGGFCSACTSTDTNIVQEIQGQLQFGVWGYPTYWNGQVYLGAAGAHLKTFSFNTTTGSVSTSPIAQTAMSFGGSGGGPSMNTSVSSSGTSNGIVWGLDGTTGVLYAFNASNLTEYYNSNQAPNNRDLLSGPVKFLAPTVANGLVYVGSIGQFGIYGLLPFGSLSSTALDFGTFTSSSSFPKSESVTLTNTGEGAFTVSQVAVVPGNSNLFQITAQNCTGSFAPNASCSVTVTFETHSAENSNNGLNTATLVITDTASNNPQDVALTATFSCPGGQCQK